MWPFSWGISGHFHNLVAPAETAWFPASGQVPGRLVGRPGLPHPALGTRLPHWFACRPASLLTPTASLPRNTHSRVPRTRAWKPTRSQAGRSAHSPRPSPGRAGLLRLVGAGQGDRWGWGLHAGPRPLGHASRRASSAGQLWCHVVWTRRVARGLAGWTRDPGPQELLPHVDTGQDQGGPGHGVGQCEGPSSRRSGAQSWKELVLCVPTVT